LTSSPPPLAWRLRAGLGIAVIPPLVSLVSFSRLGAWLDRPAGAAIEPVAFDDEVIAAWVDGVMRRLPSPWRHTCLKRSAVLFYLLRRAGRPVELCIGVRRDNDGKLTAHAWLTRDGHAYLERTSESMLHRVIARLPNDVARAG
jgi:hypothetical protein